MPNFNPLRTDKVSGILTGSFGITMMGFSGFCLLIILLQRALFAAIGQIPSGPDGFDFAATMNALHQVWFTYMPMMFGGGLVFAICGWRSYRGSHAARRVAQANALLGYAWGVFYTLAAADLSDRFGPQEFPFELSPQMLASYRWFMIGAGVALNSLFPTGLLFILPPPKQQTLDAIVC